MAGEPRVQQLLEEILDSGHTPEEVCRACPELLPTVRVRWRHLRAIQTQLASWFSDLADATPVNGTDCFEDRLFQGVRPDPLLDGARPRR
jgi:hypothetical protein